MIQVFKVFNLMRIAKFWVFKVSEKDFDIQGLKFNERHKDSDIQGLKFKKNHRINFPNNFCDIQV